MIRFDVNGSDHYNSTNDTLVPTPHLHIFTEEFDNGRIAVPLSDLQSEQLIEALIDSLEFFMDYSNINCENVTIETNLL
ncbi:hypothetical protein TP70_08880 [Staphylococcus microti]|nr:hypothetical protein TP70_08880 [Staphylococcus microti]